MNPRLLSASIAMLLVAGGTDVRAQHPVLKYNNPLAQSGMYNSSPVLRYNNPTNQTGMYLSDPVLRYNNPLAQTGMYGGANFNNPLYQGNFIPGGFNNPLTAGNSVPRGFNNPLNAGNSIPNGANNPLNAGNAVPGGFNNPLNAGNFVPGGFNNPLGAGLLGAGGYYGPSLAGWASYGSSTPVAPRPMIGPTNMSNLRGFNNVGPNGRVSTGKTRTVNPNASAVLNGATRNKGRQHARQGSSSRRSTRRHR